MRYLVTGAAGMLGQAICAELAAADHESLPTDLSADGFESLDIRSWTDVRRTVVAFDPDVVLHLAAETDVDRCEREPDHAFETNAFGTENVARSCRDNGCVMVYISTGNVFDGNRTTPYTEYDEPHPINVYGESKLRGEQVVETSVPRHFIIRAGWMVGGWEVDKKFVYKIVQMCLAKEDLRVVNDKFGSPTFTVDFARNLMPLMESGRFGLYHMANRGTASRLDIAREIVGHLGVEKSVQVTPVSSDEFPLPAKRPASEMIRNFKLDLLGLNAMPDWRTSLKRYIVENAFGSRSD